MKQYWKISLSNKSDVITDAEGYKKLVDNINSNFVIIGNEMVNPSFIISVTQVNEKEEIKLPKTDEQILIGETIKKQISECKLCLGKEWTVKVVDGYNVATPCSCQVLKEKIGEIPERFRLN